MAGAIHDDRLHWTCSKGLEGRERIQVLLEDKNTVIYEGDGSFDVIVLD